MLKPLGEVHWPLWRRRADDSLPDRLHRLLLLHVPHLLLSWSLDILHLGLLLNILNLGLLLNILNLGLLLNVLDLGLRGHVLHLGLRLLLHILVLHLLFLHRSILLHRLGTLGNVLHSLHKTRSLKITLILRRDSNGFRRKCWPCRTSRRAGKYACDPHRLLRDVLCLRCSGVLRVLLLLRNSDVLLRTLRKGLPVTIPSAPFTPGRIPLPCIHTWYIGVADPMPVYAIG